MTGRLQNQLRPRLLTQFFGLDSARIFELFHADRAPHGWILAGEAGTGKTSLAHCLGLCYQFPEGNLPKDVEPLDHPIFTINAGDHTGVEGIRALIRQSEILPCPPSKARVFILDEAHALSAAAQKSLLRPTENGPGVWILSTTDPGKLSKPLRDRCLVLTLDSLEAKHVPALMKRAAKKAEFSGNLKPLWESLKSVEDFRPRAIINACELFFAGATPDQAVFGINSETGVDVIGVCRAVAGGNRRQILKLVADADAGQLKAVRLATLSYLRKVLLGGNNSEYLTGAIKTLASPLPPEDPASAALIVALLVEAASYKGR